MESWIRHHSGHSDPARFGGEVCIQSLWIDVGVEEAPGWGTGGPTRWALVRLRALEDCLWALLQRVGLLP